MTAEATLTPDTASPQPARPANDWRFLLALFTLAGIVESQAFGHLGAFTPLFLQQLRVPAAQVPGWTGVLSALGFVLGLPLLPFWGVWADRYGRKLIIVRSAYVEGVLFTLAALSPNVWVLAAARLLTGFVFGNTGVMLAMLADVTPRKRLGLAVGIASAGFPLGASIGPLLGGLVVQGPGIRALLIIDAALSALIGLLLTLAIRPEARTRATGSAMRLLRQAARDIVASPGVLRIFILYFVAAYGLQVVVPFVPIRLQGLYTGDPRSLPVLIGGTLTFAGIAMAVATPIWGRLGDLVGRRRVLPLCIGIAALGLFAEWAAPALLPFQAAYVGVGLFQSGVGPTVTALLAILAPETRRASILNFSLFPQQLSWFLGPATGALLVSLTLTVTAPFLAGALALCGACALAATLRLREE